MPSTPPPDHTLRSWTSDALRRDPLAVAALDGERAWTRRDVEDEVTRWEGRLAAAGASTGDRVAALTRNRVEHLALLLACARQRLVLTPLSWRLPPRELAAQLAHAEPAVVVSDGAGADLAAEALATSGLEAAGPGPIHLSFDPPATEPGAVPTGESPVPDRGAVGEVREDDPLLMLFTAGTTGRPKAAVLSQGACWWTNASLGEEVDLGEDDVVLSVLPQFHVAGWNIFPLLALRRGALLVQPHRFDPALALDLVERHRVTTLMGVPATYRLMAEAPGFADRHLGSLRHAVVGGASCPPELVRTWAERGVRLRRGYGLTEAGPNVLCEPRDTATAGAGRPYPHVEVALADPGTGSLLDDPTATGELVVRGPGTFSGYWRDSEGTERVLRDGWLHTGDLAERHAGGGYRVLGRLDDMFVSGGENVQPARVEEVLRTHPDVADVAVVGVPDERWGQVGLAVVVPRPGTAPDEEALRTHARADLAGHQVPRYVRITRELPRSVMSKVLRAELREAFLAGRGHPDDQEAPS